MKSNLWAIAAASAISLSAYIMPAAAECYGDAAAMYGCGAKPAAQAPSRVGTLERFGGNDAPVLPDVGYQNQSGTASDVITAQESRKMLRSIVLGRSGSRYSQRTHIRAMNSSAQPLRRAGAVTFGSMGGGGGGGGSR
jgi:hypothetical protein